MRLAFDVAERELGIPALLDPDELVSVEEPDLLSILTYVSQLYCVFRGNSHVSQKTPVNNESSSTKTQEQTHTLFSSDVVRSSDKSVCSVCHTRVHLIQRVLVKGQLYHRSCFRCSRCRRSLLPISFTVDSETGSLQCSYPCKPASDHDRPTDQYSQNDTSETDGDRSETERERSETGRDRSETDGDKSEMDGDRSETERDRSETEIDRSETDGDRSETDGDKSEMDGDRSETERDRIETDGDKSETDRDRSETDRDRSETEGDRIETDGDKSETERDKSETDGDRSETDGDRSETDGDRSETDGDRSETERDRSETERDRSETEGDRIETDGDKSETDRDTSETDGDRSEMDGDRSETDDNKINDGRLSTSLKNDIQVPPKPAPRKRAEPQEPPCPTPRSPDHRPDNVLSQSALRKEHPWMKLVDPGPWSHLPSAPSSHSRHRPVTFNPFLEDESKDEEKNSFSCETSVAHKPQTSSSVPSMHQAAALVHGFPLIKRKVITDTRVSEKQVCEEQKKLEERLLELERRGVQLETEMRRCTNESLLVDWFLLIHMKNMLVRRDTELVYMVKQQRLEDQQADVEFEIRRLFNKPEQDWSSDERHQEHQLMSSLLSIIQQRNDIISSLDEDRQREKEEDTTLNAVIQRMEFLTQTDKQRDKCSRSFKRLQMFKKSSCKTENTGRRKKKNS
uniref:MICAL like 1b, duplicate 2 n=1 Tax=Cyprinus carpio TaxID=7962 RepID=A0A8C1U1B0_CYPCA